VSLYPWEQYTTHDDLDSILVVKMYDSVDQGFGQVEQIARWVDSVADSAPVLVHCQAGLNRSSLVVARALMFRGYNGEEAIDLVARSVHQHVYVIRPSKSTY
jgi:protein-tyrosine phosphatase